MTGGAGHGLIDCDVCGRTHHFGLRCPPARWGAPAAVGPGVVPAPPLASLRRAVGDADAIAARAEADGARTAAAPVGCVCPPGANRFCDRPDCPRQPRGVAAPRGGS